MEIKGKVIAKPNSEAGVSSRGPWKRAYLVVRYEEGQYPKDILLSSMRRAEDMERIQIGQSATFKFDAKTRQSQSGKWFCELDCWGIEVEQQTQYNPGYPGGPF